MLQSEPCTFPLFTLPTHVGISPEVGLLEGACVCHFESHRGVHHLHSEKQQMSVRFPALTTLYIVVPVLLHAFSQSPDTPYAKFSSTSLTSIKPVIPPHCDHQPPNRFQIFSFFFVSYWLFLSLTSTDNHFPCIFSGFLNSLGFLMLTTLPVSSHSRLNHLSIVWCRFQAS